MAFTQIFENQAHFREFQQHFASWHRLEPRSRTETIEEGLQAAIADPLWMLARQWQTGEFKAEDNGSPVRASVAWRSAFLKSAEFAGRAVELESGPPLEAIVERESVPFDWHVRVRLGQQFGRFLLATGDPNARTIAGTLAQHSRFKFPSAPSDDIDYETARFLNIISGRVIDIVGGASEALDENAFVTSLRIALPDNTSFKSVEAICKNSLGQLKEHVKNLFTVPDGYSAWNHQQLGYDFKVTASGYEGSPASLSARNYRNGDLDWYTFTADAVSISLPAQSQLPGGRPAGVPAQSQLPGGRTGGTPADNSTLPASGPGGTPVSTLLSAPASNKQSFSPIRARFRGMPHRRWWRIEDNVTDFGSLDVATTNLLKLILMEFAFIQGDDWYVHPLPLPMGSLTRIDSLIISDVFGQTTNIPLGAEVANDKPERRWEMFSLSRTAAPTSAGISGVLFVPPAISVGPPSTNLREESLPVEEVGFSPDEGANMFWAVEHTVRNGLGKPVSGREAHAELRHRRAAGLEATGGHPGPGSEAASMENEETALPRYLLATKTPDHWVPFLPERKNATSEQLVLRQGRAPDPDVASGAGLREPQPQTIILGGNGPALPIDMVDEDVLAGSGLTVQLTWQRVRWFDGRTYVWLGRKVVPGAGAARSGLNFDVIAT